MFEIDSFDKKSMLVLLFSENVSSKFANKRGFFEIKHLQFSIVKLLLAVQQQFTKIKYIEIY